MAAFVHQCGDSTRGQNLWQIAKETVTEIHRRRGPVFEQHLTQRHSRLGPEVGLDKLSGRCRAAPRVLDVESEQSQPGGRCPQGACHPDQIAGVRARSGQHAATSGFPERGHVDDKSPGERTMSPPAIAMSCRRASAPKPSVERLKIAHTFAAIEPERYHGKSRTRAHGGKIRDIDSQALMAEALPIRPIAAKVHVLDQAVGRHNDLLARRRLPDRCVVANPDCQLGRGSHFHR